ncbi:MAG: hypothetical protein ABUS79_32445, partial [Pseudomonadota bacterium]
GVPDDDHKATPFPDKPPEKRTFRVEIETDPRAATLELDGRPVGAGALDQRMPLDGTEHVIVARAPGYRETTVRFTDHSPPHLLALDPTPVANTTTPSSDTSRDGRDGQEPNAGARRGTNAARATDRSGGRPTGKINLTGKVKKSGRHRRDVANAGDPDQDAGRKRKARSGAGSGLMPNGAPIIE